MIGIPNEPIVYTLPLALGGPCHLRPVDPLKVSGGATEFVDVADETAPFAERRSTYLLREFLIIGGRVIRVYAHTGSDAGGLAAQLADLMFGSTLLAIDEFGVALEPSLIAALQRTSS